MADESMADDFKADNTIPWRMAAAVTKKTTVGAKKTCKNCTFLTTWHVGDART